MKIILNDNTREDEIRTITFKKVIVDLLSDEEKEYRIEACSDTLNCQLVRSRMNGFVQAVHTAFSEHIPLEITRPYLDSYTTRSTPIFGKKGHIENVR
jgi:hypothetical protein